MVTFSQKGDFSKLNGFFEKLKERVHIGDLNKYGREGVAALMAATPFDTGLTAMSWYYEIEHTDGTSSVNFYNSNVNNGVQIAVILQYGHGTNNGGYVQGVDYINPALQPIFERIADEAWKEVTKV